MLSALRGANHHHKEHSTNIVCLLPAMAISCGIHASQIAFGCKFYIASHILKLLKDAPSMMCIIVHLLQGVAESFVEINNSKKS